MEDRVAAKPSSLQIMNTTVRLIECTNNPAKRMGTGFFFNYANAGEPNELVIVTCRHVISGIDDAEMTFSVIKEGRRCFQTVALHGVQNLTRYHPDDDVDLAVISLNGLLASMAAHDSCAMFAQCALSRDCIPSEGEASGLSAFQEVVMLGYPIDLIDKANNMPIARRGMMASPYVYDFQGKKDFMLDIACFHGSSGSPVLVVDESVAFHDDDRSVETKLNRLLLLGVAKENRFEWNPIFRKAQKGNEVHLEETDMVAQDPVDVALCVKSRLLLDIEPAPTKAV